MIEPSLLCHVNLSDQPPADDRRTGLAQLDALCRDGPLAAAAVAVLDAGDDLVQALATLAVQHGRLTGTPAWDAITRWAEASNRLHAVIDRELEE
jgi:hypothetical protein